MEDYNIRYTWSRLIKRLELTRSLLYRLLYIGCIRPLQFPRLVLRCCCYCFFLEWYSVKNFEYTELNALVFSRLTACTRLQETIDGVGLFWETIGD